jgi:amino acid transporter
MLTIGAVLIWVLLWLLMAYPWIVSADIKFLAAFSYLGNVQGLPLSSFGWSWIQVVLPRSVALYYYIAAYLMQIVTVVPLVIITSRCILAWSFDRVFPTRLAHVSDRFSTPTYAVGALFGVGVVILFMAVWGNFWQWIAASSMWQLINICVVCFTGMIFPFVRKDLFEQMPTKIRVGGVPLLTIIAAIALFFGVWVGTAFFTNAKYFASLGITTSGIVGTICVYGLAAVVFLVSRAYWKRKGIDLTMAFRQIPPA